MLRYLTWPNRLIICLIIAFFIYVFLHPINCNADNAEDHDYQIPKQKDCQKIMIDERYLGGRVLYKTICVYTVEINHRQYHMWHVIRSEQIGLVSTQ